ncbi:hypothetical protein CHLNCDRAFT_136774 [Chlorella variabilis]|uniref:Amino acid transporter transmembrane domain-containing protein n=1 Tax=Chlorella variabilis TaxID=554065 RepID=E1ZL17_CHLVA|nr:hypothetical protein CHLNCDRAFT_136774 [Chlorella variabilis]EFN53483.1 hypothetical protein CHLNCDRAFT_136774 [Chlorella variabilis]|eukprot:XP_005845585.1 hypothetical protein CHLNCDRAFT_136774 [Chlorella variabilis]
MAATGDRRNNGPRQRAARRSCSIEPDVAAPPARHTGSLFGAVALITGSTVGAGMLALPAVSAPAGIMPTSLSLTAIWGLLTLDALLIAEVNLAARAARDASRADGGGGEGGGEGGRGGAPAAGSGIITLRQMAEFSLGKAGKSCTVIYLLLAYSLLTAYCTKAAEVVDYFAGGGLPPLASSAAFVGAVGGMLYLGGTRAVDSLCQGLTSVLLLLFGVILTAGASQAGLPASLAAGAADWGALEPAVPIMFLALVYHDLVPVIVDYLGGDRRSIRSAIVLGSLVPLAMFVSWEAVALSLLPAGLADSAAGGGAPGGGGAAAAAAAAFGGGGAAAGAAGGAASAAAAAVALDPLDVFVRRSSPLIRSVSAAASLSCSVVPG